MTLVEFLLARIADDEEVASNAALMVGWDGYGDTRVESGKSWGTRYHRVVRNFTKSPDEPSQLLIAECGGALLGIDSASHIARWDPARVLAECSAKRSLIEFVLLQEAGASRSSTEVQAMVVVFGVLSRLAQPYADHPDFDAAWVVQ